MSFGQDCGAEKIISAPALASKKIRIYAPAPYSFIRYLENYLFDLVWVLFYMD